MTYVRGAMLGRYAGCDASATYELDERVSYVVVLVTVDGPSLRIVVVVVCDAITLASAYTAAAADDDDDDDVTDVTCSHCCCCCCSC